MGHIRQKPNSFLVFLDHFGGEASANQPPPQVSRPQSTKSLFVSWLMAAVMWLLRALLLHPLNMGSPVSLKMLLRALPSPECNLCLPFPNLPTGKLTRSRTISSYLNMPSLPFT